MNRKAVAGVSCVMIVLAGVAGLYFFGGSGGPGSASAVSVGEEADPIDRVEAGMAVPFLTSSREVADIVATLAAGSRVSQADASALGDSLSRWLAVLADADTEAYEDLLNGCGVSTASWHPELSVALWEEAADALGDVAVDLSRIDVSAGGGQDLIERIPGRKDLFSSRDVGRPFLTDDRGSVTREIHLPIGVGSRGERGRRWCTLVLGFAWNSDLDCWTIISAAWINAPPAFGPPRLLL